MIQFGSPEQSEAENIRTEFLRAFEGRVAMVDFSDCAQPLPGRVPQRLGEYSLIPFGLNGLVRGQTRKAGPYLGKLPGVVYPKTIEKSGMYLDAGTAIGLAYRDRLACISSAGIDDLGHLKIVQLQAFDRKGERSFYRSGLHNGFYWRDSLVAVWQRVGAIQDPALPVVLQSNSSNAWESVWTSDVGYDDVAVRMRAMPGPQKNWLLPALAAESETLQDRT